MSETHVYDIEELIILKETDQERYLKVNPVLRSLIDGTCNENCVLFMLSGTPHVLKKIWDLVTEYWKSLIHVPCDNNEEWDYDEYQAEELYVCKVECDKVQFPKPKNIHINMMPFVMEREFSKCKLPGYLKPYWTQIFNAYYRVGYYRPLIPDNEIGKIGFLTIHESYVDEGKTQRRGGVHTESPGILNVTQNENGYTLSDVTIGDGHTEKICVGWGFGSREENELHGGIYMASTVSNSCEVWNCNISQDENGNEIIGSLGDIEHLREFLPVGTKMEANEMYWLTDRTPHESLPLEAGTYRQYFRLVTSAVSVWFEEHSTKNPMGVEPDPEITKIIKGSKFGSPSSSDTTGELNTKQQKSILDKCEIS